MFKERKSKSMVKVSDKHSKRSLASSHLHASISSSGKHIKKLGNEKKSRSGHLKKVTNDTQSVCKDEKKQFLATLPKDAAIHFGQFYGLEEDRSSKNKNKQNNLINRVIKTSPKSEFTRQMVYKLQQSAGTKEYARQVTALLEETVEPPNFKLDLPPTESSIPNGKQDPSGYPLWYKEPHEMPFATARQKLLEEDYKNLQTGPMKEIFTEDTSTNEEYSSEENELEEIESSTVSDVNINQVKQESKYSIKLKSKDKNKFSNSSISTETSSKSSESFQTDNETSSSSLSSFSNAIKQEGSLSNSVK